jgi:hypothetical protein
MFGWFRKKEIPPEDMEGYKQGARAGRAMADDLDRFMDSRFAPAFDGYISVLRGQFEKCVNPTDGPPIIAARIEFRIFQTNVDKLAEDMLGEITATMRQWLELGKEYGFREDLIRLIDKRVSDFKSDLKIKGLEAFVEMADRLKESDDAWRSAHPEMSARFPAEE